MSLHSGIFEKKPKTLDVLKSMKISQDNADRIMGGLLRIEGMYGIGQKGVTASLKLAKNEKEKNLIWYAIGLRMGILSERGHIFPNHIYKQIEKGNTKKKKGDPSIQ